MLYSKIFIRLYVFIDKAVWNYVSFWNRTKIKQFSVSLYHKGIFYPILKLRKIGFLQISVKLSPKLCADLNISFMIICKFYFLSYN